MKKLIKILLFVVPVLVIAGAAFLYFSMNSMVKTAVETVMPGVTGTTVTLSSVQLSPFSGKGAINGLVLGNPAGYKSDSAFKLGNVHLELTLKSVLSDTVVIKELLIEAPELTYETKLNGNNINDIKYHVARQSSSSSTSSDTSSEAPGKKVIIEHFLFANGKVNIVTPVTVDQAVSVAIPDVELNDIGKKSNGVTLREALQQIFPELQKGITKAVANSGDAIKDQLKQAEDALKQGDVEKVKGLLDGAKGLFKKE